MATSICSCSNDNQLKTDLNDPQIKSVDKFEHNIDLMTKAAQQGNVVAMYLLGNKYISGNGVEKDIRTGVTWLTKAAEKDEPLAQQGLGYAYLFENTIKNEAKSFFWFNKAAKQNDGISQLELANMYANGVGTAKNSEMASQWLRKANSNGIETPQNLMYLQ